MLEYILENKMRECGHRLVCGVDEAGRGPLFGPVVAAACILPDSLIIPGLDDSKKLSAKKREELYSIITSNAVAWSVSSATVCEINEYNILEATLLAMRRALASLDPMPDAALIDGNIDRGFDIPTRRVIHGDALSPSIAAASIIAKVERDRLCVQLDCEYPGYGIAKNKGYGTKEHIDALRRLGATPEHRAKFIRFLKNDKKEA